MTTDSAARPLRTIDVASDDHSLIKPGELIDIVELSPLTLHDRRIYNLLILNAWDTITEPKEHLIFKRELRGTHDVNDRVGESIDRLMGAFARVQIMRDGKPAIRRVHLLGSNEEVEERDGRFYYHFPLELRAIIRQSSQFARLQRDVMFAFSSKYALALYELVQKRGNLKHKTSDEIPVDRFRAMLGVEAGHLAQFKHFKFRAIDPAVIEVNGLGEFGCKVDPVYKGRKVVAVRLSWWAKSLDEKKAALHELRVSRVGRRARLTGKVEKVMPDVIVSLPKTTRSGLPERGHSGLTEHQVKSLRAAFPGTDIDEMERQFVTWNAEKGGEPENYTAALYGFIRNKLKGKAK